MINYPRINPVIFELGPIAPRWYGLMYLIGFIFTYKRLSKNAAWLGIKGDDQVDSVLGILVLSMLLCSRLVYVFFYNFEDTMAGPWWEIFAVWHGGLAFHGGLLGVVVGAIILNYRYRIHWIKLTDVIASVAPVGLGLGRIGNFINGELWGRTTDLPWGMVFPNAGALPRHPSQIYECLLEGVLLYIIVNFVWKKKTFVGQTSAAFLIGYSIMRSAVELVREPDVQLGFFFGYLTMGQMLSFAMFLFGLWMFWNSRKMKWAA